MRYLIFVLLLSGCASTPDKFHKLQSEINQRSGFQTRLKRTEKLEIPPGISLEAGLTEEAAVALALWNNSALQENLVDLELSRADLIQATMIPNPSLSMLLPVGAKPLELTAKYPIEIIWLRPRRVAAARFDYEKTSARLVQSALDLVRDVRVAHAETVLAGQRVKLLEESTELYSKIENHARERVKAGDISDLEGSLALTDTLQTREQLAHFRHESKMARARLNHLVGFGLEPFEAPLLESRRPPLLNFEVSSLVRRALAARPDLRSAGLGIEAAGKKAGFARADILSLTAALNAKEVGNDFLSGPGFDLSIPIFNQNQGGVAQARAGLEKAARHYLVIRDRVILEVREAISRVEQAQESVETWQVKILPPLQESVEQIQKAHEIGDSSFLAVLEASRKIADAEVKAAAANAELFRAVAELERSIGGRLNGINL